MADITVTAASVRALVANGAVIRPYTAGAALTVGDVVYIASDGDVEPADANVSLAATRGIGIVVASYDGETSIAAGNPASVCVLGPVGGFSDMTPGSNVHVSDTAGKLADSAGTAGRIMGYAESATVVFVHPQQNDPTS